MADLLLCTNEPDILAMYLEQEDHTIVRKALKGRDFEGATIIGEIKRKGDLFRSIQDRRYINQMKRMRESGKRPFVILADVIRDERYRLEPVLGALLTAAFHYGVTLIPVPNNEQIIAWVIHKLLTDIEGQTPNPNRFQSYDFTPNLHQNITVNMLRMIPGVGLRRAITVGTKYPSIVAIGNAPLTDLQALEGIGPKLGAKILRAITQGTLQE
ncbi:MAG: ERCC4 domain-containing protein [Candidatus Thorarchaeota archaeon]